MVKGMCSFLMLLGRICLSAAFLWAGFYKIFEFQSSVQNFQELTGMTNDTSTWIVIVSLIVEIVFGLMLLVGWLSRFAALILAIYVILSIVAINPFWTMEGMDRTVELMRFLKGIGIVGGLLYVMASGAGCCSCDRSMSSKSSE